jgi:hypothetical protein
VQDLAHIGGRVSNGNRAVDMVLDVVLQITLDGSDVHGVVFGCGKVVHNFVRGEEGKSVGERLEVLDDTEDACEIVLVVGSPWLSAVDALARERRVDIQDHVDTSGIEDGHALGMVEGGVDIVDTDSVHLGLSAIAVCGSNCTYTELLHDHRVTETHVGVCEGILLGRGLVSGLTSRLVVNTNNHQPLPGNGVDEILAADLNRVDGVGDAREQGGKESERANELSAVSIHRTADRGSRMFGRHPQHIPKA